MIFIFMNTELWIFWQIYPVDSLKSIYQRDVLTHRPGIPLPKRPLRFSRRMYYRFSQQVSRLFTEANMSTRYRGLGVSMTRSAMLNAVFFSSYEFIKRKVETLWTIDDGETLGVLYYHPFSLGFWASFNNVLTSSDIMNYTLGMVKSNNICTVL